MPGDGRPAPQTRRRAGRAGCFSCRSRTSASAAGRATPPTSTRCRATTAPTFTNGRRSWLPRWSTIRCSPTSIPTSNRRGWRPIWSSTAPRASRLGVTPARSTTRCTTRSASARCPRSTARRTSIMSSWRWSRGTGRHPETLQRHLCQHRRAGRRQGTQTSNAVVGTVRPPTKSAQATTRPTATTAAIDRRQFGAQRGDQRAGQYRQRQRVVRRRGQHQQGNDGAAGGLHHIRRRATRRWRSTIRGRSSPPRFPSIWRPENRSATRPPRSTEAMRQIGMPASIHGSFAGTAQTFQAVAGQRADPDRRGADRRLHRAGRAV